MAETTKTHGLTLRIDIECRAQLKTVADAFNTSQSEVVRTLIRTAHTKLLKNQEKIDGSTTKENPGTAEETPSTSPS